MIQWLNIWDYVKEMLLELLEIQKQQESMLLIEYVINKIKTDVLFKI